MIDHRWKQPTNDSIHWDQKRYRCNISQLKRSIVISKATKAKRGGKVIMRRSSQCGKRHQGQQQRQPSLELARLNRFSSISLRSWFFQTSPPETSISCRLWWRQSDGSWPRIARRDNDKVSESSKRSLLVGFKQCNRTTSLRALILWEVGK